MGNHRGGGCVNADLYIIYFPGKIQSQVISIAFLLGACVLTVLPAVGWRPLEVAKTFFFFFYGGIQEFLELCSTCFSIC